MNDILNYPFLSFILLDNNLSNLYSFLKTDFSSDLKDGKFNLEKKTLNIESIISTRITGGKHLDKVLFFESILLKDKTIMVSNSYDGRITLANHISFSTNRCQIAFFLTLDEEKENDIQYMFVHRNSKEEERIVYSMKEENKWVFFQEGDIQTFENAQNYKKRRISERLNYTILIDYCNKLGLDITNNNFWKSNREALYLEENELNRKIPS